MERRIKSKTVDRYLDRIGRKVIDAAGSKDE
jgi:hypothetical protein